MTASEWMENQMKKIRTKVDAKTITIDNVNKPRHYTAHPSGVECIQVTECYNFNVGNAIKYLWRAGLKKEADKSQGEKHLEDLQKARWYIDREITRLTK